MEKSRRGEMIHIWSEKRREEEGWTFLATCIISELGREGWHFEKFFLSKQVQWQNG